MKYEIDFYKPAYKSLQKLDKITRNRISDHLHILSENPRHPELDIKRMRGTTSDFRLRVGAYRIIYSIDDSKLVIVIIKIGSRGDIYKG